MTMMFRKGLSPPPQGQPPWYPGANGGVSFGEVQPANPIRGHLWWDGTYLWVFDGINWVTDGFSEDMVDAMLLADPFAFMPPVTTDGSLANIDQVGYVWTATGTGSWSGPGSNTLAPLANIIPTSPPLPVGDWDIQWQMILPSNTSTSGVSTALIRLPSPLPSGLLFNMQGYGVNIPTNLAPIGDTPNIQPMIITGPVTPFSNALSQALVFNLYCWASGLGVTGTYTMNVWGRRVR